VDFQSAAGFESVVKVTLGGQVGRIFNPPQDLSLLQKSLRVAKWGGFSIRRRI
jgi:hypothetical protein